MQGMDENRKKLNNMGFTLIELIVAFTVSVFVMMIVVTFLSIALKEFRITGTNTALQQEAQIAQNQVGQLIMEAESISKDEAETEYDSYIVRTGKEVFLLVYDHKEQRLLLGEISTEAQTAEEVAGIPKRNLLASHVSTFKLEPHTIDSSASEALVQVNIDLSIGDKTLSTGDKYVLRNGVW